MKQRLWRNAWLLFSAGLLCMLFSACASPGVTSTAAQLPLVTPRPQPTLAPVHFPQDEGAHDDLTEWWYYTGHLSATDATGKQHTYGFEFVIFQVLRSDLPPVYAAHFAISDITRGTFHYAQRRITAISVPIPSGTSTTGISEQVGDWSMRGLNGQDHLVAAMQNYAINLRLTGLKPPILHKDGSNGMPGLISTGLNGFSYYDSRTRMSVVGTILDHNQALHVTGLAWMDHQWGNFLLLGAGGWDWYSIQLNNDTEVMIYVIRNANGVVAATYAEYIDAAAHDDIIQPAALHIRVLDTWTSPTTGITYPSGWRLTINTPQVQTALTITPLLKNQELVAYASTDDVYWEGAVSIQGQSGGESVAGQGYVELTGYAQR